MELKQAGEKTYYIENETNIGLYMTGRDSVCIIDTGSQGDGEKIDEIITDMGWQIDYIINTHTHIDHIGGNAYLMKKYDIPAFCADQDIAFAHYTDMEAAYMNGGRPPAKLRRIFAHPGKIGFRAIEDSVLEGISWTYLPGHSFGMIGVKTGDDVWFTGDSYLSREYLKTHRFGYLCDVQGYLENLERLKRLEGKLFVPSHGIAEKEIREITALNRINVNGIIDSIRELCREEASLDCILQGMYQELEMRNTIANHALLSSTIKSYITYLQDREELACKFTDNIMTWKTIR